MLSYDLLDYMHKQQAVEAARKTTRVAQKTTFGDDTRSFKKSEKSGEDESALIARGGSSDKPIIDAAIGKIETDAPEGVTEGVTSKRENGRNASLGVTPQLLEKRKNGENESIPALMYRC